ncbi:hypothetical protein AgCh_036925 [Apium graveolens]
MLVQQSWYHLIRTPEFVSAHYNYHKLYHSNHLLFEPNYKNQYPLVLQCEKHDIPLHYPQSVSRRLSFYCVSNGLICFATGGVGYNTRLWLWNPAIRKFKTLPVPQRPKIQGFTEVASLAFGFCPKHNDIKVVKMVMYLRVTPNAPNNLYTVADVYSLSTNSWKTTNNNPILVDWLSSTAGLFLKGTAFFCGINVDKNDIIVSYDIDKDTMRMISFPENARATRGFSLEVFGKSVALFMKKSGCCAFNVWFLKEGGTDEVYWEKQFSFNLPVNEDRLILGICSNGEVILGNSSGFNGLVPYHVVSYNVEKNEVKDFGWLQPQSHSFVNSFTESLFMISTKNEDAMSMIE